MPKFSPVEHVQLLGDKAVAARWLPFARQKFRALDNGKRQSFFKLLAVKEALIRLRRFGKVRVILIKGLGREYGFIFRLKHSVDGTEHWWPEDDSTKYHIWWSAKDVEYLTLSEIQTTYGFIGQNGSVIDSTGNLFSTDLSNIYKNNGLYITTGYEFYPGANRLYKHFVSNGKLVWVDIGSQPDGNKKFIVYSLPAGTGAGAVYDNIVTEYEMASDGGLGIYEKTVVNGVEQSSDEIKDRLLTIALSPTKQRMVLVFASSVIDISVDESGAVIVERTMSTIPAPIASKEEQSTSRTGTQIAKAYLEGDDSQHKTCDISHTGEMVRTFTPVQTTAEFVAGVVWTGDDTYSLVTCTNFYSKNTDDGGTGTGTWDSHYHRFHDENGDLTSEATFVGDGSMEFTETEEKKTTFSFNGTTLTAYHQIVTETLAYSFTTSVERAGVITHVWNYGGFDLYQDITTDDKDWNLYGSLQYDYYVHYQDDPENVFSVTKNHEDEAFGTFHTQANGIGFEEVPNMFDGSEDWTENYDTSTSTITEVWYDPYSPFGSQDHAVLFDPQFEAQMAEMPGKKRTDEPYRLYRLKDSDNLANSELGWLVNTGGGFNHMDESILNDLVGAEGGLPDGGPSPWQIGIIRRK